VLAAKGGIDLEGVRNKYPRLAVLPFDAAYKFMATFHNMTDEQGKPVVRCMVKGAPDVVIGRSSYYWLPDGEVKPLGDEGHQVALDENQRIGEEGERPYSPIHRGHRRSATRRSERCNCQMPQRRHPGTHDHR
jgi:Ca2+-transporting ATPase